MKMVKYEGQKCQTIVEYVRQLKHPSVVKVTISYLSNSITSEFVKSNVAIAYTLGRGMVFYTIVEGSSVRIPIHADTLDERRRAMQAMDVFLGSLKGQFELILYMKEDEDWGIAFVEYFSPENW